MAPCNSRFTEHFDMSPSIHPCSQWSPSKSSVASSTDSNQDQLSSSSTYGSRNSAPGNPMDDDKASISKLKRFFRRHKK
ncbi:hypothetical protein [Absidia glauca]|uniref:Uncharacterized protein n=1 Tax=Absidia glauca TaxID=4829 RepID=A0A168MYG7_ABSGL|nr:hypothetical protein [Absidia glauca]